ncbi:MAG: hypothetical protein PUB19_09095 [Lachnospiraceae bacterium]|nr:hypothetical protein [Lachnospiraceae bacterium]
MNISGIRPVSGYYDYNEIKRTDQISTLQTPEISTSDAGRQETEITAPEGRSAEVESRQTFGAYDYASQYNPDATYSLKGAESDIRSLDVEKAISDMRKDEVIHQYQYFVGQDLGANVAQTSTLRGAEDFVL